MSDELLRLWPELQPILDQVLELEAERRSTFLEQACSGRPDLQRAIERLLAAERQVAAFMVEPPAHLLEQERVDESLSTGALLGPYRIVGLLGRGGMGAVFLAERADGEYQRQVAIKVIDRAVIDSDAVRRFRLERQILARLDHPGIARMLDGGMTDDGRPFIVMERIEGLPLTDHCRRQELDLRERLRLFLQVCDAVRFAHGQLVVHRDLKPGNILITATGEVKLLDFGIAKQLAGSDGVATETQGALGTPAFAAPEQLASEPVTAATDIYQLGLVLYELLTDRRVADRQSWTTGAPERPSRIAPREIASRIAGDLDAIVLKMLRESPGERYSSVDGLVADLEAHLESRPVAARGGTHWYLARKFVRRNRIVVLSVALVLVALVGGVVVASAQARVASAERDRAREAQARAAAINDFLLNELLRSPAPEVARGEELTVRQVLEFASRSVDDAFPTSPELEASVRETLARSYASLGSFDDAERHARAALDRVASTVPGKSREVWRLQVLLAELDLERGHYTEAGRALDAIRSAQLHALGADDRDSLETLVLQGRLQNRLGDHHRAEMMLLDALARLATRHPDAWRLALRARSELGAALTSQHKLAEAETVIRETLDEQRRRSGDDHPDVVNTLERLATVLGRQQRYAEATDLQRRAIELRRNLFGPDHAETGRAIHRLAVLYDRQNLYEQALEADREAYRIFDTTLGTDHPDTIGTLRSTGVRLSLAYRLAEAEPILLSVRDKVRWVLGEDHPWMVRAWSDLSHLYERAGRLDAMGQAERAMVDHFERRTADVDVGPELLEDYAGLLLDLRTPSLRDTRRAIAVAERAVAATGRRRLYPLLYLGLAWRQAGDPDRAIETIAEALETDEALASWYAEQQYYETLIEADRPSEAERFLLENLERRQASAEIGATQVGCTLYLLGDLQFEAGRYGEARRRFEESLERFLEDLPESDWRVGRGRSRLGESLFLLDEIDRAEPLLVRGFETMAADPRVRRRYLEPARQRVVRYFEETGRLADAERWRRHDYGPRDD